MLKRTSVWALCAVAALLRECAASGPNQPPGIDYLGAGYDMVFGNPDGSEAATSVTDPGFREHIIKYNWDPEKDTCSGMIHKWTCPAEVSIYPQNSCIQQSSSSEITSTKQFQQVLRSDASVSASAKGGYMGFKASASFSASKAMQGMKNKISKEKITTFQSKAVCVEYAASLKTGLKSNHLETLPEFNQAIDELPKVYCSCFQLNSTYGQCPQRVNTGFGDLPPVRSKRRRLEYDPEADPEDDDANDCECDASVIDYFRFIQLFGTHYTTDVEMGGKVIRRVEIKESDVSSLQTKKVDVRYGASMKASYKSLFASASVSASMSLAKSKASRSYESVMSVAQKESNINVGGSPSEDWREWAKSTTVEPMPVRYKLSSLTDLIAKRSVAKAHLFDQAVADYISAYGRVVTAEVAEGTIVTAVEFQYSLMTKGFKSATFKVMIGKKGDMIPQTIKVTKLSGSFRVNVPKQYMLAFGAFQGTVPITIEFVSGVFPPKRLLMLEAHRRQPDSIAMMEADFWKKKKKKKKAKKKPAPSTPKSVFLKVFQPFAIMSDDAAIPLDDQYAGKQLDAGDQWPCNPID